MQRDEGFNQFTFTKIHPSPSSVQQLARKCLQFPWTFKFIPDGVETPNSHKQVNT